MSRANPVKARDIAAMSYPPDLPVAERRSDIAAALAANQVIVVAGETGSGKTTQLPKICLDLGRGREQRIGHTQPRRLAARTVAQRIAEEVGSPLGGLIGYQVRFNEQVGDATAVKLMTDGILLSEMQRDRKLSQYDTLIIDEAHERSLNIDFILGYLKRLLPRRPDLKVIITSATIDVQRFSEYFGGAPIIEVSGRSYPVETHYLPRDASEGEEPLEQLVRTVFEVQQGNYGKAGDMLVFLPGERDIRDATRRLRGVEGLDVLPLYARLSQAEQARAFGRSRGRGLRVVLATNVAETSVTVPGIRFVIDPGDVRISRYSYRTRVQRLPIEPVSQASADQRRGRCGRVGPGVCLRLYSEEDYLSRPEFTDPEIMRSNLAAVVLQMLHMGLGDVERFPFIDAPDPRLVRDGYRLLEELGAVDERLHLSQLGRKMAAFPVDPTLARMVLAAQRNGVLPEMLVIASALAVQDPRERPADKQQQADQAHARFRDPRSDFLGLLNLWHYYEGQRQELSENRLRKLCKREFFSYLRMREWRDVHRQLSIACRSQGLRPAQAMAEALDYEGVHRSLLAGLLGNIAQQDERREYFAARNRKLHLFPGSALSKKPPKWLVAGEVVETQRVYARTAAAIDVRWVLDINPALLKHSYYEPRWQRDKGRVVAWRRSTLFGLTVSDRVSVHYAKTDPVLCRELLIREGLVVGRWPRQPAFLRHNLRRQREVEALESKMRRRDLLVDEEALFRFYDERLPEDMTTAAGLAAWIKADSSRDGLLRLRDEHLLTRDPGSMGEQFPDTIEWDGQLYRLSYEFSPGGEGDGVSATVPVALLNRVPRFRFEWLIRGLLREKCIAMIKALPKGLRKQMVPVPDWVDRALQDMSERDQPLAGVLAERLRAIGGPSIASSDWDYAALDDYYRMNFRVVDEKGRLLEQNRDLPALVERFQDATRQRLGSGGEASPQRSGLTRWDFDALPREWRFSQADVDIVAYPGFSDRGEGVDIALFDYPGIAWLEHRAGLARLLILSNKALFRDLKKRFLRDNETALLFAALDVAREALVDTVLPAVALEASGLSSADCFTQQRFDQAKRACAAGAVSLSAEYEAALRSTLQAMVKSVMLLQKQAAVYREATQDLASQRQRLLGSDSLAMVDLEVIRHYPRYARAMLVRVERLAANYQRDQEHQQTLAALEAPLIALEQEVPGARLLAGSVGRYAAMLDELRVSLYAQHLGTAQPVSVKRLRSHWEGAQSWLSATGGRDRE
ncbi:MAG: ATP-dependent helicase HrpA [Halieaceae bacterium]|jgi:ATP-dependent helicase HrpA